MTDSGITHASDVVDRASDELITERVPPSERVPRVEPSEPAGQPSKTPRERIFPSMGAVCVPESSPFSKAGSAATIAEPGGASPWAGDTGKGRGNRRSLMPLVLAAGAAMLAAAWWDASRRGARSLEARPLESSASIGAEPAPAAPAQPPETIDAEPSSPTAQTTRVVVGEDRVQPRSPTLSTAVPAPERRRDYGF